MARGGRTPGLIWRLSWADVRHEWLLSLCMVLAIASILAPLLLLFGLKFGTIETMRHRLLEDPRNREIRPLTSRAYEQGWFDEIAAWPEVDFIIPYTRQISASLDAYAAPQAPPLTLDVIPTAPGDPWLSAASLPVPERGQILLSRLAAEGLGVGSELPVRLRVAAKRLKGSAVERAEAEVEVIGVFSEGGPATKSVFVPLSFLEDIERYKDGQSVPDLNWPGALPKAYPVFTSLLIEAEKPVDPTLAFRLINNTGFTSGEPVDRGRAGELLGRPGLPEAEYYLLTTKGEPAAWNNLKTVTALFRGRPTRFFPLSEGLTVTLTNAEGSRTASLTLKPAAPWAVEDTPDGAGSLAEDQPPAEWLKVLAAKADWPEGRAVLEFRAGEHLLRLPVAVEPSDDLERGLALAPLNLLGRLSLAGRRPLRYEEADGQLLLGRRAYAGFRLYAASLEAVSPLRRKFEALGLDVATEAARIEEVVKLDRYLDVIFWLIALGAVVGGAASLLSNMYAGLERKRRELGVLRLLGVSGAAFLRFPLYSSLMLTAGGFVLSWLLFTVLAAVINHLFQDHLKSGESLCRLAPEHMLTALFLALAVSACAGLAAAVRARRVEPAEALRDE